MVFNASFVQQIWLNFYTHVVHCAIFSFDVCSNFHEIFDHLMAGGNCIANKLQSSGFDLFISARNSVIERSENHVPKANAT